MMACRIEQARQDCEHGSNEIHRWPPCALVNARLANLTFNERSAWMSIARANFKKLLTRRANHGYVDIIAEIVSPRRETGSGFFVLYETIDRKSFNSSN
jgi:hypothetical protein